MALTKVLTGGLAADSVDNTILKLDDDYALTGTVSGAGVVLQVVKQSQATRYATTSTSYQATYNKAITPSATSSKILITFDGTAYNAGGYFVATVFRGTTSGTDLSGGGTYGMVMLSETLVSVGSTVLDSPSTTSATTYTVAIKAVGGGTASFGENTSYSHITLMEIAG